MISIIIPVYNIQKEYLTRCIDSVLNQTYRDIEVILVDDGSTDGSAAVLDEYAEKDSRVKALHKKNGGSSSARNFGILNSRGDYLGFVDSDDYIEPDMYESLLNAINKYGVKCAQVGRNEIDEEGNILPDICFPPETDEIINKRDFFKELLMHRGDCSFCTKLIARDVFFENDHKAENGAETAETEQADYEFFPRGVLNEDFHILIKKLGKIGDIVSLPGYKYHVFYRIGSNSRKESKNEFSRVFFDCVNNADLATDIVKEEYPGDTELEKIAFRFNVFQRIEYLLHIPVAMMEKDSPVYDDYKKIAKWMKKNWSKAMGNPYLTKKNKAYHTLFAIAPKTIRGVHKKIKKL